MTRNTESRATPSASSLRANSRAAGLPMDWLMTAPLPGTNPAIPYTSNVQDAPATPINPVAGSSTMMDQVAEADEGSDDNNGTAATRTRRSEGSMQSPVGYSGG